MTPSRVRNPFEHFANGVASFKLPSSGRGVSDVDDDDDVDVVSGVTADCSAIDGFERSGKEFSDTSTTLTAESDVVLMSGNFPKLLVLGKN